ncbi:hypothetical protein ADIAL_0808 [Alkalibacterium sp. AK22]|nr:hypothetical protein ADIAL_0808 [Alkalibacterium sp. AK22]
MNYCPFFALSRWQAAHKAAESVLRAGIIVRHSRPAAVPLPLNRQLTYRQINKERKKPGQWSRLF